jgi:2-phospho-L-lactate guanylyltransferase
MRATQVVASWGCNAVLVLPADLPMVRREDIAAIIERGQHLMSVVLTTDSARDGTNALFMRPPGLIPYTFGPGSFDRHLQFAREAGAEVSVYESLHLSLDIDLPQDLERYNQLARAESLELLEPFALDN